MLSRIEYILYQIDNANCFFEDKKDLDLALSLQHYSHVWLLTSISRQLAIIEKEQDEHYQDLENLLHLRLMCSKLRDLLEKYASSFTKVKKQYKENKNTPWMGEEDINILVSENQDCIKAKDPVRYLTNLNKNSIESRKKMSLTLGCLGAVLYELINKCLDLVTSIEPCDIDIKLAVRNSYQSFARDLQNSYLRQLKQEAQKYKSSRSESLTPEVWGRVLENEERALELAVAGQLSHEITNDNKLAPFEAIAEQMENSYDMIQKILNVSNDENLFDFEYASEQHINLYSTLKAENLDLFNNLILRHDIIRTEMHPELKQEFELLLNPSSVSSTAHQFPWYTDLATPSDKKQFEKKLQEKVSQTQRGSVEALISFLLVFQHDNKIDLPKVASEVYRELQENYGLTITQRSFSEHWPDELKRGLTSN